MSPILEVLIGMIFLYSLLAILVTQINAGIARVLQLRPKHLRGAIDEMIQDPILRAKIITHPLIKLSKSQTLLPTQKITEEEANTIINGVLNNVSWINPETFVNVLINQLKVSSDKELFYAMLPIIDGMPDCEDRRRLRVQVNQIVAEGTGITEIRQMIDEVEDPSYKTALGHALAEIDKEISDLGLATDSNIALMAGLRNIKNIYFRTAMETIIASSKSLDEAKVKIGEWFDDGMSRASDSFKTTMQYWSLGVGLVIALLLNVDSLYIAQTLWNDPALRTAVSATVQNSNISALEATNAQAEADRDSALDGTAEVTVDDVQASLDAISASLNNLLELRLPLGWNFDDLSSANEATDLRVGDGRYFWNYSPTNNDGWWNLWIVKLMGIGATVVATAQGAPFWFGILRKLSGQS